MTNLIIRDCYDVDLTLKENDALKLVLLQPNTRAQLQANGRVRLFCLEFAPIGDTADTYQTDIVFLNKLSRFNLGYISILTAPVSAKPLQSTSNITAAMSEWLKQLKT
ncbi:hypothetical protein CHS0354_038578 [Potamilus streckersoni]|uniref:Uncharacterized protein n=1 Tax=Potamilus streckersoni TaxID=2493646 RepID=A0AAE0RS02_9BIVA|nr:hypothetical protein CHS0354_038578 [Potamilus streckersoni]